MLTGKHYCPVGDVDCPYYTPSITQDYTCGMATPQTDCDAFYGLEDEGE